MALFSPSLTRDLLRKSSSKGDAYRIGGGIGKGREGDGGEGGGGGEGRRERGKMGRGRVILSTQA